MGSLSTYTITTDDFKDTKSIDALVDPGSDKLKSVDQNDSNGYTPLCFASLNGIEPKLLVYLINNKNASTSLNCAKGKSPMQLACLAMNVDAVNVLIGNPITYIVTDSYGNPEQAYSNNLPEYTDNISNEPTNKDKDANGNKNAPVYKTETTSISSEKVAAISDNDILQSSILQKEELLKVLLEKFCECTSVNHNRKDLQSVKDSYDNNPLHLAVIAQCYGSVDTLLAHCNINKLPSFIFNVNSYDSSAYDLAIDENDIGLQEKLLLCIPLATNNTTLKVLEEILVTYKNSDTVINAIMPKLVSYVFRNDNVYDSSIINSTSYTTSQLDDNITVDFPSGTGITILDYFEAALSLYEESYLQEYNHHSDLYTNLVNQFFVSNYTVRILNSDIPLIQKKCYSILNILYANHSLDLKKNSIAIENAITNRDAIRSAVSNNDLDSSKLDGWPWWLVTLSFINSSHQDLQIHLPESCTDISGTIVLLQEITGEYEDSNHIKWKPSRWDIGEFNSYYTLNEDTAADLVCEKVSVPAGIIFDTTPIVLTEGGFTYRTFKLLSIPSADVELHLSSDHSDRLSISQNVLIFTPDNWNTERQVTFTAIENLISDGTVAVTVTISALSSDTDYNSLPDSSLSVTINDNDSAGLDYNTSPITVIEGGSSVTRSFKLRSQPTDNVTVNFASDHNDRLNISPTVLTFTISNWDTSKNVVFTAINNSITDGDITANVSITTSSNDLNYDNLLSTLIVNIIDDDVALGKLAFTTSTFAIDTDISSVITAYPDIKTDFPIIYSDFDKP